MANDLKPTFQVNGNTIEIKCTRALLVEYNRLVDESPLAKEDEDALNKIAVEILKIEESVNALAEKLLIARDEFYDDPTNEAKEAKFRKLEALVDEQNARLDVITSDKDLLEKRQKELLNIYEKVIIYALVEQGHSKTQSEAIELWQSFVEETGKRKVSEWVMAIGDTLFNKSEDENSFLARKRAKQMEMLEARRNIKRK